MSDLSLFDLTGLRALVTGSSQGIGLALAAGLLDAGARVVLNGRDEARLAQAARLLEGRGPGPGSVRILPFDVTDHAASRAAVDGFEAAVGPIGILVSNAGIQHRAPLEDVPAEAAAMTASVVSAELTSLPTIRLRLTTGAVAGPGDLLEVRGHDDAETLIEGPGDRLPAALPPTTGSPRTTAP